MEKLRKIGLGWMWGEEKMGPPAKNLGSDRDRDTSKRLFGILESILLWENSVNSISVVIVFNILFW